MPWRNPLPSDEKVDLRRLRYFVLVAEESSFSRAARRAGISQQALSNQIKSLEREIDCVLFFRTTRQVELSPAGRALLPKARASLANAAEALASARAAGPELRYLLP
jgi:DNA-binding transcriptional LysR family regulator